jgi:hypothetical protein
VSVSKCLTHSPRPVPSSQSYLGSPHDGYRPSSTRGDVGDGSRHQVAAEQSNSHVLSASQRPTTGADIETTVPPLAGS